MSVRPSVRPSVRILCVVHHLCFVVVVLDVIWTWTDALKDDAVTLSLAECFFLLSINCHKTARENGRENVYCM